ncbi:MAG: multisubunit Na+/H+ antiporter MnhE subunit [Rhodothermales bacterium]|jgi:multisubunit Na+/H+ antiporter MnhE subunit
MILRRLRFLPQYMLLLIKSNLSLAWLILGPGRWQEHELELTVPHSSPTQLYLLCNLISFTPGSLVIDCQDCGILTVHILADERQSEAELRAVLDSLIAWLTA